MRDEFKKLLVSGSSAQLTASEVDLLLQDLEELDRARSAISSYLEVVEESCFVDRMQRAGVEAVKDLCQACEGLGVKTYATTATWRGGIGGAAITVDVCDSCWGSGASSKPWLNLRLVRDNLQKAVEKVRSMQILAD
jgi:hypothetical protein